MTQEQSATRPAPSNLYQKLTDIYRELEAIKKTGVNREQQYKFIEQGAVVAELRALLGKHGVVLTSEVQSLDITEFTTAKGTKGDKALVKMRFTLINATNPSERVVSEGWPGLSMDYSDKAVNKAMTAAVKTFLMKEFMVSEFDPDSESPELPEPGKPVTPRQLANHLAATAAPQRENWPPARNQAPAQQRPRPLPIESKVPPTATVPESEDDDELDELEVELAGMRNEPTTKAGLEMAEKLRAATNLDALKSLVIEVKKFGIVKGHSDYESLLRIYRNCEETIKEVNARERAG